MIWIRNSFRIIKKWFSTYKKKWLVFILLSIFFFAWRFPYNESILYLIDKIRVTSGLGFYINYKKVYLSLLGPALVFEEPEIQLESTGDIFKVEEIHIYPSYKALMTLKAGVGLTLKWSDSEVSLIARKKRLNRETIGVLVSIKSARFDLSQLSDFFPIFSKISGYVRLNGDLWVDPEFNKPPEGSWRFSGRNVNSRALSYTFPGSIGTISLPTFQWSRFLSQGTIENGKILIAETSMGEKNDPFQIKTRGMIELNFFRQSFSQIPRIQLNNYTLGMEIITHSNIKSKLYFLDIFFSSVEEKTSYGSHYLVLLQGNKANLFDMSQITKLPTLEEILEPPEPEF